MTYHHVKLKRAAKKSMALTRRPRVWFVTVLFLLMCSMVTSLFGFVTPDPFEILEEPFGEALELAEGRAIRTGDVKQAYREFRRAWKQELEKNLPAVQNETGEAVLLKRFLVSASLTVLGAGLLSGLAELVKAVLDCGYRSYCLGVFRRQNPSVERLFDAFPNILNVLGARLMMWVFSLVWILLGGGVAVLVILLVRAIFKGAAAIIVGAILCLMVAICVRLLCLQYALTPYIVVEFRDVGIFESIRYSRELMQGNKVRRLFLELSFLGWYFLLAALAAAVLTVGGVAASLMISVLRLTYWAAILFMAFVALAVLVPMPIWLWLVGYQNTAYAGFYHIVSFPEDEDEEENETEDEESQEEQTAETDGQETIPNMPVWANAPEEEVLPPYEETAPEEETSVQEIVDEAPSGEPIPEETPAPENVEE